jgi:hypothetical protein
MKCLLILATVLIASAGANAGLIEVGQYVGKSRTSAAYTLAPIDRADGTPESSTVVLLLAGLGLIAIGRRKRRGSPL